MKALLLNGSSRKNGCTYLALSEVAKVLNAEMPIASSTHWNMVFGPAPEKVEQDKEGLQTMRNLARNMAWLLRCIQAGQQQGCLPLQAEREQWTNFNP